MRCRIIEELLLSVSLGFFSTVYRQHIRIVFLGTLQDEEKHCELDVCPRKQNTADQNLSLPLLIRNTAH